MIERRRFVASFSLSFGARSPQRWRPDEVMRSWIDAN